MKLIRTLLRRIFPFLIVSFPILVLDQLTKSWVVNNLQVNESIYPIPALRGLFSITYLTNTGVAFGLFKESGTFFIFLVGIVIAVLLYMFVNLETNQRLARIALAMAVSGAVGNLFDRLRVGYVVDFIDFRFVPVFNIADFAVVFGIVLLMISMWYEGRGEDAPVSQPQELESSDGEQMVG